MLLSDPSQGTPRRGAGAQRDDSDGRIGNGTAGSIECASRRAAAVVPRRLVASRSLSSRALFGWNAGGGSRLRLARSYQPRSWSLRPKCRMIGPATPNAAAVIMHGFCVSSIALAAKFHHDVCQAGQCGAGTSFDSKAHAADFGRNQCQHKSGLETPPISPARIIVAVCLLYVPEMSRVRF